MEKHVLRRLFLGFIQIHILHHAQNEPLYGTWMLQELKEHGYEISPGTLYPILHGLADEGLLDKSDSLVEGKIRKYYTTTAKGRAVLREAKIKAAELYTEICETNQGEE
ncbi:MAG: PadR family transcriptional regulator [Bacillota bacterium]|nr:PadR family transcriptional regulator [Bacillota bacterium]MDW7684551.1 PadR family transcriptional regulator [Bacillota bacterium]